MRQIYFLLKIFEISNLYYTYRLQLFPTTRLAPATIFIVINVITLLLMKYVKICPTI